jgi:hypothetical protein
MALLTWAATAAVADVDAFVCELVALVTEAAMLKESVTMRELINTPEPDDLTSTDSQLNK